MTVIPVSTLLDVENLNSVSVEMFIAALARELHRRGDVLDLEMRTLNISILNESQRAFLLNRVRENSLIMPYSEFIPQTQNPFEVNLDFLASEKLFLHTENGLSWSFTHAKEAYRDDYGIASSRAQNIPYMVLAIAAKHFIDYQMDLTREVLTFHFDDSESVSSSNFMTILLASEFQSRIAEALNVDHSLSDSSFDFSYFISKSHDLGYYRYYSVDEKIAILDQEGFKPGGIYVLWNRGTLSKSNNNGKLYKDPVMIRFDGITEDRYGRKMFSFTALPDLATMEERIAMYNSIEEGIRHKYTDLLNKPSADSFYKSSLNLMDMGIGLHLQSEVQFVDRFDYDELVDRLLQWYTAEGESVLEVIRLSAAEFVYWVLCQWEVPFDKELYLENYNMQDVEPLYDLAIANSRNR